MNEGGVQPKAAKLTGQFRDVGRGRIMWECQCPNCKGPQWAIPPEWDCVWCDYRMRIKTLRSITPVKLPAPRSEETDQSTE